MMRTRVVLALAILIGGSGCIGSQDDQSPDAAGAGNSPTEDPGAGPSLGGNASREPTLAIAANSIEAIIPYGDGGPLTFGVNVEPVASTACHVVYHYLAGPTGAYGLTSLDLVTTESWVTLGWTSVDQLVRVQIGDVYESRPDEADGASWDLTVDGSIAPVEGSLRFAIAILNTTTDAPFDVTFRLTCDADFDVLDVRLGDEAILYGRMTVDGTVIGTASDEGVGAGLFVRAEGRATMASSEVWWVGHAVGGPTAAARLAIDGPATSDEWLGLVPFGTAVGGPGDYVAMADGVSTDIVFGYLGLEPWPGIDFSQA
jgi:hypothetical protein